MPTTTLRLPTGPAARRPGGAVPRSGRRGVGGLLVLGLVTGVSVGGWAWWNGSLGSVTVRPLCTATAGGVSTTLDPEQAGNAAVIAGIAQRRGLPARAASIGIATAMQESKLRNIEYGDRDSLGLFQQRPSQGWGTKKQILDPVYATNPFYDVLGRIDGFVDLPITDVAQKVQRSAFPDAYADHEPEARIIASSLSGYSPGGFSCELRPPTDLAAQSAGRSGRTPRADAVAEAAREEIGARPAQTSGAGKALGYALPESRQAWALASWAVARADGLQVVEVRVGDQVWERRRSTRGWQQTDPLATGRVQITVG